VRAVVDFFFLCGLHVLTFSVWVLLKQIVTVVFSSRSSKQPVCVNWVLLKQRQGEREWWSSFLLECIRIVCVCVCLIVFCFVLSFFFEIFFLVVGQSGRGSLPLKFSHVAGEGRERLELLQFFTCVLYCRRGRLLKWERCVYSSNFCLYVILWQRGRLLEHGSR